MVTATPNAEPRAGGTRPLVARWVISAELTLLTAAHLGGDEGDGTDMAVLRDRRTGRPLLTGASLTGALRSALLDRRQGYRTPESGGSAISDLFGAAFADSSGGQSALIVFDARGELPEDQGIEVRDGVRIDPATGLALDRFKYDLEVLPPGTRFPLRFELLVPDAASEPALLGALAEALEALDGAVRLGARGARGLGRLRTAGWCAARYDLSTTAGWREWLLSDHLEPLPPSVRPQARLRDALRVGGATGPIPEPEPDSRRRLAAEIDLQVQGGLLVRAPATTAGGPDVAHLRSGGRSVLPGTSLAGALRARARRILHTVRAEQDDADAWVDALFGATPERGAASASRLIVGEAPLDGGARLAAARTRIDRFTGGTVDSALHTEAPDFGATARLTLNVQDPRPGEEGLVLLLLKDLLTGVLPLGGATAVGRGAVAGYAFVWLADRDAPVRLDPTGGVSEEEARALNAIVADLATAPAPERIHAAPLPSFDPEAAPVAETADSATTDAAPAETDTMPDAAATLTLGAAEASASPEPSSSTDDSTTATAETHADTAVTEPEPEPVEPPMIEQSPTTESESVDASVTDVATPAATGVPDYLDPALAAPAAAAAPEPGPEAPSSTRDVPEPETPDPDARPGDAISETPRSVRADADPPEAGEPNPVLKEATNAADDDQADTSRPEEA